jgi:hypothetical protein
MLSKIKAAIQKRCYYPEQYAQLFMITAVLPSFFFWVVYDSGKPIIWIFPFGWIIVVSYMLYNDI